MTEDSAAEHALRRLWELIDSQRWDDLGEVLDPSVEVTYVHTGETFDLEGFVQINAEYPGTWRAEMLDLVANADRCVTHTRVSDGDETYHVASFAQVRDGVIAEMVELWTDSDAEPPTDRRP